MAVIDTTKSLCPVCMEWVECLVTAKEEAVLLQKRCPKHGMSEVSISQNAGAFKDLRDFYFKTHKEIYPQTRYLLFLTPKCNLSCPICFLEAGLNEKEDIYLKELTEVISDKNKELILFGAEPTCRTDLCEVIKALKKRQYSVSLYSNGINLVDFDYVSRLRDAGTDKIYLQFDGFDDRIHQTLRNKRLAQNKSNALDNIKKLKIPLVLDVAILKTVNDAQIAEIFDYSLKNNYIRAINFIAYVRSGAGRDYLNHCSITPEEIFNLLIKHTNGKISSEGIRIFQKLMYLYMYLIKRRTCFYIQYFWVYRVDENNYFTLDEIVDFKTLEKFLDKCVEVSQRRGRTAVLLYIFCRLPGMVFAVRKMKIFAEMLRMVFVHCFKIGDYAGSSKNFLQLIFATACDPCKADLKISQRCHVGIVYKNKSQKVTIEDENSRYLLEREIYNKNNATEDVRCG